MHLASTTAPREPELFSKPFTLMYIFDMYHLQGDVISISGMTFSNVENQESWGSVEYAGLTLISMSI